MAKHILNDVTDDVKRDKEIFLINPANISVVNGWNDRTDFSGEDELMTSIKEVGVKRALKVRKTPDKTLELVDGERRLRATMRLINEQGLDIRIPVIVLSSKVSEIDLYLDSIIENTGKPLSPVEEANSFKRLVAWGLPIKEIADKSGRSISHIRNRLSLSDSIPAVKEAVSSGDITAQDAIAIVKQSGGKVDTQTEALEKTKLSPKPKPVHMFISGGEVRAKGKNGETCEPLSDLLTSSAVRQKIIEAGFEPDSIKISILRSEA